MSNRRCAPIQFHGLVAELDALCEQIVRGAEGELTSEETEVVNYFTEVRARVIAFCMRDPIRSYVFKPGGGDSTA